MSNRVLRHSHSDMNSRYIYTGRLELDIMWDQVPASSAVQQEPLNPGNASDWRVHVIDPAHAQTYGHSAFSLHVRHRSPFDNPVTCLCLQIRATPAAQVSAEYLL